MTIAERTVEALRASTPQTAAQLARVVLPDHPPKVGANVVGSMLRNLRVSGVVRSKPGPRPVGRGKRALVWELTTPDVRIGYKRRGRPSHTEKLQNSLAPDEECGTITVPTSADTQSETETGTKNDEASDCLLPVGAWVVVHPVLSACTEPHAIRAKHKREVAAYLAEHPDAGWTELSEALCLPVWNCQRLVAELRGEPLAIPKPQVPVGKREKFGTAVTRRDKHKRTVGAA